MFYYSKKSNILYDDVAKTQTFLDESIKEYYERYDVPDDVGGYTFYTYVTIKVKTIPYYEPYFESIKDVLDEITNEEYKAIFSSMKKEEKFEEIFEGSMADDEGARARVAEINAN